MTLVDVNLQHAVEHFYREEAAALDEKRFHDWLDLFSTTPTTGCRSAAPAPSTSSTKNSPPRTRWPTSTTTRPCSRCALRKLDTGYSWSEDPPSRTRHVITNVRVIEDNAEDIVAETNFILYRTRLNSEEDMSVGMRRDRLKKGGEAAGT